MCYSVPNEMGGVRIGEAATMLNLSKILRNLHEGLKNTTQNSYQDDRYPELDKWFSKLAMFSLRGPQTNHGTLLSHSNF